MVTVEKTFSATILLMLLGTVFFASCSALSTAHVSVFPGANNVEVDQVFTIKINITDVSELAGFDFCLSYDKSVLSLLKVEEGPFMKSFGNTYVINLTKGGLVWLAVVLYSSDGMPHANGSGVLAILTFKALSIGVSWLDLHSINPYKCNEIKLAKGCEKVEPIPNVAHDGYVIVSAKSGNPTPPDPPPGNPPADPPADPPANSPTDPPENPPVGSQSEKSVDLNEDGKIDIRDIAIVAKAYDSYPGHPNWNEKADIDNSQKVDIVDISKVAIKFKA